MSLLAGVNLSSYADECIDAAHSLDQRRRAHETRHRRFRLQLRPATREWMEQVVSAVGPTELVYNESVLHVPVKPVAGGVAFAPERMTISALEDVYNLCLGIRQAPGKVYDRVWEVLSANPTGLRLADLMDQAETARTSTQRAAEQLEREGKIRVRLEKTRDGGTPRKRYFPIPLAAPVSIDRSLGVSL